MRTAFVWHERLMWFDSGSFAGPMPAVGWVQPGEPSENPEAKRRIKNLLDATGFIEALDVITPGPASEADILRVHPQVYLEKVKALSAANGGQLGASAFMGPATYDIVMLSTGAAMAAMDAVLSERARYGYAFTRPPGHHAEPQTGLGFCVFANIPIAIKAMKLRHGIERVAVVDWDVHHGNGTQACFYDDPSVLTISLHQNRLFPRGGIGSVEEKGEGKGVGANINVPLPAGCGTAAYRYAFDRVVMPALEAFKPQLIVVANGLDAGNNDPLGRMMLGPEDFRWMTASVARPLRQAPRPGTGRVDPSRPDPVGQEGQPDHDPVGRHEAARDDREGAVARTARALSRRADGRRRRRAAQGHVAHRPPAARRRRDDHPDHPLHRGGRGDGRPDRRDQQGRPDHPRRGQARS